MTFSAPRELEKHRLILDYYDHDPGDECNGLFEIKPMGLRVIISNGGGWEHVSVSRQSRTPSYEDMNWVKNQFWSPEDCVMQLHVPVADHVNCHDHCLHLWRPTEQQESGGLGLGNSRSWCRF